MAAKRRRARAPLGVVIDLVPTPSGGWSAVLFQREVLVVRPVDGPTPETALASLLAAPVANLRDEGRALTVREVVTMLVAANKQQRRTRRAKRPSRAR